MVPRVMEKDFGMILVSPDEPRASSVSPNIWDLVLGGPCEVEGPSSCSSGWIVVVWACGRALDGLRVRGVCSGVARSVQCVPLHKNHCVASWSCDLCAFRKKVAFAVVGGNRGGTGGVMVCSGYGGVCIEWVRVCSGGMGVCSSMLGGMVGTRG